MTSTCPDMPRKGSSHISAQDLLTLLGSKGKNGFLRQKRTTKFTRSIKWQHRFVILASNALYIFETEMSKSPDVSVPLLGYIGIEREKTSTCAWVFALVPGVSSLSRRSFACSNDDERREWMYQIKEHLYSANNVKDKTISSKFKEKLKLAEPLSPDEQSYLELEIPIIDPDDVTGNASKSFDEDDQDDEDDDNDISEEDEENTSGASVKSLDSIAGIKIRKGRRTIEYSHRRPPSFEQTPSDDTLDMPDGCMPPRYSAIVNGKEQEYQNLGSTATKAKEVGLETACTIQDEDICRDRDACIKMLMETKKVGTYLIRKSRSNDYKVLAVMATEDSVKEYRIEEAYGLYHFFHDKAMEFPAIGALLSYYSHQKPVPTLGIFLGWGIHEWKSEDGETYEESF